MFVKVTTRYKDLQLNAELPEGVILDVTPERAEVLFKAGKAEEFNFTASKPAKNKKSEEPVVEESIATEEPTVPEVHVDVAEDAWKEPTTVETPGE